jgi:uncharacterized surface protein with fasciclin (FAS1) repeats
MRIRVFISSVACWTLLAACGAPQTASQTTQSQVSVMAVLRSDPNLSSFVAALEQADLASILSTQSPLTVFAPSNQALTTKPADMDYQTMQCHIVVGRYPIQSLTDTGSGTLKTLSGQEVTYSTSQGVAVISGEQNSEARITAVDIAASNGIVHQVDNTVTC